MFAPAKVDALAARTLHYPHSILLKPMPYLFHPSGGLLYHLRAWRWRRTLWAQFHAEVRAWLSAWRPKSPHLVLIGPSGGYALCAEFLARFTRISVLEPDPLARWLLRRRFPSAPLHWEVGGTLARTGGFDRLAAAYPDAALLFCNLLGQELQGQAADFNRGAWLAELEQALRGRSWASWHDLVSTARAPTGRPPSCSGHAIALEELLGHYWLGGRLEFLDHETASLCPAAPRRHTIWHLAPRR